MSGVSQTIIKQVSVHSCYKVHRPRCQPKQMWSTSASSGISKFSPPKKSSPFKRELSGIFVSVILFSSYQTDWCVVMSHCHIRSISQSPALQDITHYRHRLSHPSRHLCEVPSCPFPCPSVPTKHWNSKPLCIQCSIINKTTTRKRVY
jgi:hypothetical protein